MRKITTVPSKRSSTFHDLRDLEAAFQDDTEAQEGSPSSTNLGNTSPNLDFVLVSSDLDACRSKKKTSRSPSFCCRFSPRIGRLRRRRQTSFPARSSRLDLRCGFSKFDLDVDDCQSSFWGARSDPTTRTYSLNREAGKSKPQFTHFMKSIAKSLSSKKSSSGDSKRFSDPDKDSCVGEKQQDTSFEGECDVHEVNVNPTSFRTGFGRCKNIFQSLSLKEDIPDVHNYEQTVASLDSAYASVNYNTNTSAFSFHSTSSTAGLLPPKSKLTRCRGSGLEASFFAYNNPLECQNFTNTYADHCAQSECCSSNCCERTRLEKRGAEKAHSIRLENRLLPLPVDCGPMEDTDGGPGYGYDNWPSTNRSQTSEEKISRSQKQSISKDRFSVRPVPKYADPYHPVAANLTSAPSPHPSGIPRNRNESPSAFSPSKTRSSPSELLYRTPIERDGSNIFESVLQEPSVERQPGLQRPAPSDLALKNKRQPVEVPASYKALPSMPINSSASAALPLAIASHPLSTVNPDVPVNRTWHQGEPAVRQKLFFSKRTGRKNPSTSIFRSSSWNELGPPPSPRRQRHLLAALRDAPVKMKCADQQLINGSQDDAECFFYREQFSVAPTVGGDASSVASPKKVVPQPLDKKESIHCQDVPTVVVTAPSDIQQATRALTATEPDKGKVRQSLPYRRLLNSTKDSSVSADSRMLSLNENRMDRMNSTDSQRHLIGPAIISEPNIGTNNNAYHTPVTLIENGPLPLCDVYSPKKGDTEDANTPTEVFSVGNPKVDTIGKKRVRLVEKHGQTNISHSKIPRRLFRYWFDIFTTMVEMKWRYVFVIFASQFFLSWIFFALLWYLICWAHGDFDKLEEISNDQWKPCVTAINDFTSTVLFSIETQHTIGYGARMTTEECPEAVFVMMIQSIFGIFGQACIVGLVFTKLARPKKRAETLLLSKKAVICLRDRKYRLLFRVGDVRPDFMTDCKVQAILIQRKTTKEGESLPLHQTPLSLETCELFLTWPIVISHEINQDSPFFCMDEQDMINQDFELVIVVEGNVEATAMRTQIRTSYLPDEILWGFHFQPCVKFGEGRYVVDYSKFHQTVKCHMPKVSAQKWEEMDALYTMREAEQDGSSLSGRSTPTGEKSEQNNDSSRERGSLDSAPSHGPAVRVLPKRHSHYLLPPTYNPPPTRNATTNDLQRMCNGTPTAGSISNGSARNSPRRSLSQSSTPVGHLAESGRDRFYLNRSSTPVQVINFILDDADP